MNLNSAFYRKVWLLFCVAGCLCFFALVAKAELLETILGHIESNVSIYQPGITKNKLGETTFELKDQSVNFYFEKYIDSDEVSGGKKTTEYSPDGKRALGLCIGTVLPDNVSLNVSLLSSLLDEVGRDKKLPKGIFLSQIPASLSVLALVSAPENYKLQRSVSVYSVTTTINDLCITLIDQESKTALDQSNYGEWGTEERFIEQLQVVLSVSKVADDDNRNMIKVSVRIGAMSPAVFVIDFGIKSKMFARAYTRDFCGFQQGESDKTSFCCF